MEKTVIYLSNISPLKSEEKFNKYYNLMPQYRKIKIDRYSFYEDKLLSLGAGLLLKKACCDFEIRNEEKIVLNQYGKPYFKDLDIYFSLSHSKEMAMCAISTKEVGCDIEFIKEPRKNAIDRVFTENEKLEFNLNSANDFYSLWALKESLLKKMGKGFALEPKKVEFNRDFKANIDNGTLFYLDEIDGYKFSCAYDTDIIEVKNIDLSNIEFQY